MPESDPNARDVNGGRAARQRLVSSVRVRISRRLAAEADEDRSFWFGLGAMGVIGWSVAVPTVLGIAAGLWLDRHVGGPVSWTLTLLLVGVIAGSATAWRWVMQAQADIDAARAARGRARRDAVEDRTPESDSG